MSTDAVQQLVHGYANGHTLLSASTKIADSDLDLAARLSDLSGSLVGGISIQPYLTFYPLPSKRWYVVARTWLDEEAARAGCVLTHSLLVPMEMWANEASPGRFVGALQKPNRGAMKEWGGPPNIPMLVPTIKQRNQIGQSFVQKFFGEGLTPLAWFDADDPEALTEQIITALWPSIRARFAACTFALQPRTLQDRPFDLHFSTAQAFSRFGDFSREHIVDERTFEGSANPTEPWITSLARDIFEPINVERRRKLRLLTEVLDPYPTSVRQVYFLLELEGRIAASPMAAVGALDLLQAFAPTSDGAQEAKQEISIRAFEAVKTEEPIRALEVLYLLNQRLDTPANSPNSELQLTGRWLVRDALVKAGQAGLEFAATLIYRQSPSSASFFIAGIAEGTGRLLDDNADVMQVFLSHPLLGETILPFQLDLVPKLLAKAEPKQRLLVVDVVVGWIHALQDAESRRTMRRLVFPAIDQPEDAPLLEELLGDLTNDEVGDICSCIETRNALRSKPIVLVTCRLVGERHPFEVQNWCCHNKWISFQIAEVMAAGFAIGTTGLSKVFEIELDDEQNRALLVGAFFTRACGHLIPGWLAVSLETDSRVWELLLMVCREPEVAETIGNIARSLSRLAVLRARNSRSVFSSLDGVFSDGVRVVASRQLIYDYLEGLTNSEQLGMWLAEPWIPKAIAGWQGGTLSSLVRQCIGRSESAWLRGWTLLDVVSTEMVRRKPSLVSELLSGLLSIPSKNWNQAAADTWARALISLSQEKTLYGDLCDQSLRFSLQHSHLPLDSVVGEAFYVVHDAAMSGKASRWSLWSLGEWDKAKELRRLLVEAFTHSAWRPEFFALAAREVWLLRKLSKRMFRQWGGGQFLERALVGLRSHPTARSIQLEKALSEMLGSDSPVEDWD